MSRKSRWKATFSHGTQGVDLLKWQYFGDYINQKMLDYRDFVWRGQSASSWSLESTLDGLLRRLDKLGDSSVRSQHLEKFKYATRGRRGSTPQPISTDNDWWALGQHHGLATPLLDWTTSPYVAAYFAFISEDNGGDARRAVFGLSKWSIETKSAEIGRTWQGPGRAPIIEFVQPLTDENARLVNQGGLFTRAPDGIDIGTWIGQQYQNDKYIRLLKITIPNADREVALRSLNRMNINHVSLFPDLYGASKFVNTDLLIAKY
jgi:hypothetical protein